MIDRKHKLSVKRQAALLGISRGSVYYLPREVPETDLALMRRVDELHLDYPFAGSRMLRDLLAGEGMHVGRLHVSTLMKRMGIEALCRKPNTSKPKPGHKVYPYLLRNLAVTRPNQVWAIDITYVPMAKGFVYLVAVVDWFSRRVLAWRLSITMEVGFCIEAVEEAIGRYGCPEIFNSDSKPVHIDRVHAAPERSKHRDQHGRPRRLEGQCLCRASVAVNQIRRNLPPCLCQRSGSPRRDRPVSFLL